MKNKIELILTLSLIMLMGIFINQSNAAGVTTALSTTDLKYYSSGKTAAFAVKASTAETNIMGFSFDIIFKPNLYTFDSNSLTVGAVVTTNLNQLTDSSFFNADLSNIVSGTVTITGAKIVENTLNKGFANSTLTSLVDNLKFNVLTDSITANNNPILLTNFIYSDKNKNSAPSDPVNLTITLFEELIALPLSFKGIYANAGATDTSGIYLRDGNYYTNLNKIYVKISIAADTALGYDALAPDSIQRMLQNIMNIASPLNAVDTVLEINLSGDTLYNHNFTLAAYNYSDLTLSSI